MDWFLFFVFVCFFILLAGVYMYVKRVDANSPVSSLIVDDLLEVLNDEYADALVNKTTYPQHICNNNMIYNKHAYETKTQ